MRDINYQIRKSYTALLDNLLLNYDPVPVYYAQIPTGTKFDNYVLINSITNTGFNSDCSNYVNCIIQLMIVTKADVNNDGYNCDSIADQIFQLILPSPQAREVQIDGGQVISTELSLDRIMTGLTDGQKKLVNRIISFSHIISS